MLGRMKKKIFLQIFKEDLVYSRRIKKYLFLQICKEDQGYLIFKEIFMLGRKIKKFFCFKSAKLFGPFLVFEYDAPVPCAIRCLRLINPISSQKTTLLIMCLLKDYNPKNLPNHVHTMIVLTQLA